MAIIWRVENEGGCGPYNAHLGNNFSQFGQQWYHPGPSKCPVLSRRWMNGSPNDVFGFANMSDYLEWFAKPKWREWLRDNGFRLCEFKVPDQEVAYGLKQVMFNRNLGIITARHCPVDYPSKYRPG